MTNISDKHFLHQTSLPTTEVSITGLRPTAVHSSINETTIQVLANNQTGQSASQSIPIEQVPQCRICLQSQRQSCESFITPCNCTGSVRYIHLTCFTEWIRTSLVNKRNKQLRQIEDSGLRCDLCKMALQINIRMEKTLIGLSGLKNRIQKQLLYFSIIVFIMLCALALLCVLAAMLPSSLVTFPSELKSVISDVRQTAIEKVTMLCCLIVSIIVLILMGLLLVRDFLVVYKMKVWSNGKNKIKIQLKDLLKD